MTVLLIDYGMGNQASARRALEICGASVTSSEDPSAARGSSHIVIPGVGAFAQAMGRMRDRGWIEAVNEAVNKGAAVLGICLGMQLLADDGDEGGQTSGFGLVPGKIQRMTGSVTERIPHVGWNEVYPVPGSPIFNGIKPGSDFYFVHSYRFIAMRRSTVIATTPYCGEVTSAVQNGKIFGTQFHPEKSSKVGLQLMRNFLAVE